MNPCCTLETYNIAYQLYFERKEGRKGGNGKNMHRFHEEKVWASLILWSPVSLKIKVLNVNGNTCEI